MSPPIDVVAGRYRLLSLLGQGGMGSVWRGEHTSLMTPVAIKLLDPRLAQKESVRARFMREARSAAALQSQHVVQILDHGVEGDFPYIVMELLRGESLAARLQRTPRMTHAEIARLFAQMGRAVARAHKAGVIHRDLKPDNVFLAEIAEETLRGTTAAGHYVVKVVDFGIAKITEESAFGDDVSTDTGAMIGTPHYMSPEQARSVKALDARADLWSMGIIAFECVTGQRPFRADSLGDLIFRICAEPPPAPSSVAQVPEGFDAWFARATQRKPDDRFQTVADLVQALEQVLAPGQRQEDAASTPSLDPALARASSPELDATVLADQPSGATPEPKRPNADASSASSGDVGTRTGDPSAHSVLPDASRRRSVILFGLAAAAAIAVGVGLSLRTPTGDPAFTATTGTATSKPLRSATGSEPLGHQETSMAAPSPVVSASASASASVPEVAPEVPSSRPRESASAARAPAPQTPRGPASATASPSANRPRASAKPGCDEPFTVNAAGDLVPKPECF